MKLGMQVGPGHIVLDGDRAPQRKGTVPQFLAHVCCGQTAGWIKMSLGMEEGLGSGDIDGTQLPQKGHSLEFSSHVYCGQTAGCISIPLGTQARLGAGDIVLDGDAAPQKGDSPQFSAHAYCGQTAG